MSPPYGFDAGRRRGLYAVIDRPTDEGLGMTAERPTARPMGGAEAHGSWGWWAGVTHTWRWPIIVFWCLMTAAAFAFPPPASEGGGNAAESLMSPQGQVLRTEVREMEIFGFPLHSRTAIVQRDPSGLTPEVQVESVLDAIAVNQSPPHPPLLGALPVPNAVKFGAGQNERGTSVLTYLFMDPRTGFGDQHAEARRYAEQHLERPEDHVVGVTGSVPARAQQAYVVGEHVGLLEKLTLLAIVLLVGLAFRSVVVPVMALVASGVAVVVTMWVVTALGDVLGLSAPAELQPVLLALLLGVVTDYTIFYVTGFSTALGRGDRVPGRTAVSTYTPIIVAAGVTVAAGTLSLLVAESPFFSLFGPAMAITICVGLVVAVTLIPALVAVLGHHVLWPSSSRSRERLARPSRSTERVVRALSDRSVAWGAVSICTLVLFVAALPLTGMTLKAGFTSSLPDDNTVKRAAASATEAFSPGITSPTVILVEGGGVAADLPGLIDLQKRVAEQPGVSGVVGPTLSIPGAPTEVFVSKRHDAARMLVVLNDAPLDGSAVTNLSGLADRLPELAAASGLAPASIGVGGDTALAVGIIDDTVDDLGRLAVAGLVVNLLILVVFLRCIVAPVYLLACNVLSVAAALGLATWLFTDVLGEDGITFYVPFAAAVLLVALGSDYNIFGVGRTWAEARRRPLHEAMAIAMPESTKAIDTAGLALAVSFGMLAVIPLSAFRELGFAMCVGVLLDVFVVRAFMVPALLTLFGDTSVWPRRSFRDPVSAPAS